MDRGVERKVVTILFCDLVGFTSRFDLADPEDVRDALAIYHARVAREIKRFGGVVEKFIGDAVVAVYGVPVAHEDDARRAIFSALRIPPAIEELNEAHPALELAVRIGIETGDAVVAVGAELPAQGIAVGDVVSTTSRLQTLAPTGGIVVGERAHGLTRDLFDFEQLEPVSVKGKADPLRVWLARASRSRFGAELLTPPTTPMVDREDELELLKRTFARAVHERSAQLVTLMGEPGVGKSRLIREFFARLDDQPDVFVWRQGRSLPYGEGVTFWALGQIVKAQAGILESDDTREAAAKLGASLGVLVDDTSEQEWVRSRIAPLIGLADPRSEGADRTEAFSAWRRYLEAIASIYPLVVVLEDLHWADTAQLDFVEYLADWSSGVPILILCSARPELFERTQNWGGGKRNSITVSLPPLTDEDTKELVSQLLPSGSIGLVGEVLVERAGGNPLFAEELARTLQERAVVTDDGSDDPFTMSPPESLHAIIAARLDTLPTEQKTLLQDAAVVGKVFWPGALAALGDADEETIRVRLHELTRSDLVRPSRISSVANEQEFAFAHALIRDVAYGQIPREPRAAKHIAAASWIEAVTGERVSDQAEVLAHHYERALSLSRAAGRAETGSLEEATRRYWVLAGDRAMGLDVAGAEACFDRALQTMAEEHPGRAAVLAKKAEASLYQGRYAEARRRFEEVVEVSRAAGDFLTAGAGENALATVMWQQGDADGWRSRLSDAVRDLEHEPPSLELADCQASIASDRLLTGHFEDAIDWSERSLDLAAKLGDDRLRPRALSYRGLARCYAGDLDGLADLREALATAERLGLSRENARVLLILAEVVWASESPTAALEATRSGEDVASRRGLGEMLIGCQTTSLGPLFDLGRWDELLGVADEVIDRSSDAGGGYYSLLALPWKAQVLLRRGRASEAAAASIELVRLAKRVRDAQVLVPALVTSALVSLHGGNPDEGMRTVADLEAISDVSIDWYREQCIADLVRICVAAGDAAAAQRFLDAAGAFALRHRLGVLSARASLAEATGATESAERMYEEAARGWQGYGHVLEMGLALLGAGRCLTKLGRPEASDRLRGARDAFEALGAPAFASETDAI
jgi:class 3 adenylate cyclase/tetratricopeptide (TPR) repeat protein